MGPTGGGCVGGVGLDAELAHPVLHGVGIKRDRAGELGEGVDPPALVIGGELGEESGAFDGFGTGGGRGTADAPVAADDEHSACGGVVLEDVFDEGVGFAVVAGVDDFGLPDPLALDAGRPAAGPLFPHSDRTTGNAMCKLGGDRASAIADEACWAGAVAAAGQKADEPLDFEPGEAWRQDTDGVQHVVGVDEQHGRRASGSGLREGSSPPRDRAGSPPGAGCEGYGTGGAAGTRGLAGRWARIVRRGFRGLIPYGDRHLLPSLPPCCRTWMSVGGCVAMGR